MNINLITTETLNDTQILKSFGETLFYNEGKFIKDCFFENIIADLGINGLEVSDGSKKEIMKQLSALLIELTNEL